VPSNNSAKNQRFFLSRLAGSRALPSEDITGLKQKILAGFSQIFPSEKLSRSLSLRSSPTGCLSPMLVSIFDNAYKLELKQRNRK